MKDRKTEIRTDCKRKHETLTGGCCQWRDSASYDSGVHIETFVLRGNFSGKIATEQQPPTVMGKFKKRQKGQTHELSNKYFDSF